MSTPAAQSQAVSLRTALELRKPDDEAFSLEGIADYHVAHRRSQNRLTALEE